MVLNNLLQLRQRTQGKHPNVQIINQVDTEDSNSSVITKNLVTSPRVLMPVPECPIPDHSLVSNPEFSNLVQCIQFALSSPEVPLCKSPMIFRFDKETAVKNALSLQEFDFSIEKMLKQIPGTSLHAGSEFRNLNFIRPLLDLHPYSQRIQEYVQSGISYDFVDEIPFSEEERQKDINQALHKDINNKSASSNPLICEKAFEKEIGRGWSFVLPLSVANLLQDRINFIPLGTAPQWTIDEHGNPKRKYRLTQDCSRLRPSGKSINSCTDKSKPSECYFGGCLNRILLRILFLRHKYPNVPILINKYDLDSAYRRMHIKFEHSLLECWKWNDLMFINSRLPFGYEKACEKFSHLTDLVVDLAQRLAEDDTWNPSLLHSDLIDQVPQPVYTPRDKASARPLQDSIECFDSYQDGYIDDLIGIVVVTDKTLIQKVKHAVPLILSSLFRPIFPDDAIHLERAPILAPDKLLAEGGLTEIKTILGWVVDTDRLLIRLPLAKAKRYLADINALIDKGNAKEIISSTELETLIGKMVHVSQIAKEGLMFLNRFRFRMKSLQDTSKPPYLRHLHDQDIKDLVLWKQIIKSCVIGRDINIIVKTVPMFIFVSDAAESNGLGGWLNFGPAWRFELPSELLGIFSSNLLECIAAYWSLKLLLSFVQPVRARGRVDNAVSTSWLVRNRFDPHESPAHDELCRLIGEALSSTGSVLDPDHLDGDNNIVADSLSRDTNLSIDSHTAFLKQAVPACLPEHFQIIEDNSKDLRSLLDHLASLLPSKQPTPMRRTRSELQRGHSGSSILRNNLSRPLSSSTVQGKSKFEHAKPFATQSDLENWEKQRNLPSKAPRSATSLHKLIRPSAKMTSNHLS